MLGWMLVTKLACITEHRLSLMEIRQQSIPIEFAEVTVPAGSFLVGSAHRLEERPIQQATLTRSYSVMRHEVTQQLYLQVMNENPSFFANCPLCPVEKVRWVDAVSFANELNQRLGLEQCYQHTGGHWMWLNGQDCLGWRLPTELEWERAALGGQLQPSIREMERIQSLNDPELLASVPMFSGAGPVEEFAWLSANSERRSHPVCQLAENGYGICDMTGNVFEWVWDSPWTFDDEPMLDRFGAEQSSHRIFKGGSWVRSLENQRIQGRRDANRFFRINDLGFRLVRTIASE